MSSLSEMGLYDLSIARRSPVTGTDGSHCFQSVRVRVRLKRHSLGIKIFGLFKELPSHPILHVLREPFDEN